MKRPNLEAGNCALLCSVAQLHPTLRPHELYIACQAPLSMECSVEYWNELPFPTPRALPTQGLNTHLLCHLHWQVDSLPLHYLGIPYSLTVGYSLGSQSFFQFCRTSLKR